MSHFAYTAVKNDNEIYTGAAEANDRFELYQIVRREGGRIVSVSEAASNKFLDLKWWNALLARVSEYEKILFARNLGAMLSAGLPLARALSVIERQTQNQKLANIVSTISSDVRRGDTLHQSLAKFPNYFSSLFSAMVRAGEEGGDLPNSLIIIAEQMERMHTLKKKIRGALIYPSIIVIAIVGIGAVMMIEVVPTLAATFKEMHAELPASTRFIIALSDFLKAHTVLAFGAMMAAFLGVYFGSRTEPGHRALDWGFLHMPVIKEMVREVNAARTSRTLASLLQSGVDVLTALEIVEQVVQNSYFKEVLEEAMHGVGQGEQLSLTFTRRTDLYPVFVGEMMAVGEETGQTTEMLKRLASFYEEEVDRKTKDMSTIIEPVLMLVIGGAVGFFAVSMISPIYSLSQNV